MDPIHIDVCPHSGRALKMSVSRDCEPLLALSQQVYFSALEALYLGHPVKGLIGAYLRGFDEAMRPAEPLPIEQAIGEHECPPTVLFAGWRAFFGWAAESQAQRDVARNVIAQMVQTAINRFHAQHAAA